MLEIPLSRRTTEQFADEELLALVFPYLPASGGDGGWAPVLRACQGLPGLARRGRLDPVLLARLGEDGASRLAALIELSRRLVERPLLRGERFLGAPSLVGSLRGRLAHRSDRRSWLLVYDHDERLLSQVELPRTTAASPGLPMQSILRAVLEQRGASFVLAQNHLGGGPVPARDDVEAAISLQSASEHLGLEFLDHILLGEGERWVSLREEGVLLPVGWTACRSAAG